jgi:hypothetical protein
MGSLKPGATYIYERAGGVIYAREFGTDPSTRKVVGYDLESSPERKHFSLWNDILKESETNPTLQKAIDRAIMIYRLSKDNPE